MARRPHPLAVPLGVFALVILAGGFAYTYYEHEQDEISEARATARAAELAEREEERERRWTRIQEESASLIPPLLEGVRLGQTVAQVRLQRRDLGREPIEQQGLVEPGMVMYEERLQNGARVVYAFERDNDRLQRIQVLSLLPSAEAVAPHLAAMNDQYGSPTGIWDCPQTGGVPTRRFTWRHGETTVSDVFLVYGGRVSVTLYIAPNVIIQRSLRMSACTPTAAADIGVFPVTTEEQMMGSEPQGVNGAPSQRTGG
ncbi:MAG: hypothetical protein AB7S26_20240 [Sandaracinaceae bacterium]